MYKCEAHISLSMKAAAASNRNPSETHPSSVNTRRHLALIVHVNEQSCLKCLNTVEKFQIACMPYFSDSILSCFDYF